VQATVHDFDPASESGRLVTDEGVLIPFDGEAFATSGLLALRPGQRLTVTVAATDDGTVSATSLRLEHVAVVPEP